MGAGDLKSTIYEKAGGRADKDPRSTEKPMSVRGEVVTVAGTSCHFRPLQEHPLPPPILGFLLLPLTIAKNSMDSEQFYSHPSSRQFSTTADYTCSKSLLRIGHIKAAHNVQLMRAEGCHPPMPTRHFPHCASPPKGVIDYILNICTPLSLIARFLVNDNLERVLTLIY